MLEVAVRHAFEGFSLEARFEAPPGVTALFGRSGSGKTTIVNAVAGLLRPDAGRVAVNGAALFDTAAGLWTPAHRRRVGYVFQEGRLFPHLTVRQNLLYGRWMAGAPRDAAGFDRIVGMLGLAPLLPRRPGALSGGEKSRVAIGRALLSAPRLILMDEPLASLDEARKAEIMPYLERLRDETETPVLYVSHSVAEVARLATTVVALKEGRVLRAGPAAEVMSDPAAVPAFGPRAAGSILAARVLAHHADGLTELEVPGGRIFLPRVAAGEGARLRVRVAAQDVMLATRRPEGLSALNILEGRIAALRPGEGPGVMVRVDLGGEEILARITRRSAEALALEEGQPVCAVVKAVSVAPGDVGGG